MTPLATIGQPNTMLSKVVKVLSIGGALLIAILVVAHFVWKYSGSNRWDLVLDEHGVKVYALKSPGSTLKQFKAVTRINTTLNRVVAAMTDTSTEACAAFVPGCTSGKILQAWNSQSLYYIQAYHVDFPFPFVDRDFVIKTQFSQDIQNKSVLVQCTALPDKLPQSVRSFHVTDMHNSWRFTPLEDGQTEVEFVGNYDLGMPYFMFNKAVPGTLSDLLPHLEELFNKDKYQHREFAFVKQP